MLNISFHSISDKIDKSKFKSFEILSRNSVSRFLVKMMFILLFLFVSAMFLPWTQNIRSKGYVTTLSPDDRPQNIQALIGGKIEKWYVREGQMVQAGDTIIKISEVKEEYLDPDLLNRTESQIVAKSESAKAYVEKARSLKDQNDALQRGREVKIEQNRIKMQQTRLKIQSDSIDLVAAETYRQIAENQLKRTEELYKEGLKSLTEVEAKRLGIQEAIAKVISFQNKIYEGRNELLNYEANIIAIDNDYRDKMAKSRSDMMGALSDSYDADANVNKLQSMYNSYSVRQKNYYITSPITGVVTKAVQSGIGEIIKNGDDIVSIMPRDYQLAIEMYVKPVDVPLLEIGRKVRIQFDGWPAIVFSGWPNSSYGTFGGKIFAIDNFISSNGRYRVLVAPDKNDALWPVEVRVGGGASAITLLNDVTLGYELWRQLNGFPQDYYKNESSAEVKPKVPLKKIK